MDEQPRLVTRRPVIEMLLLFILCMVAGIGGIILACFLISQSFNKEYFDMLFFIIGIVCALMGVSVFAVIYYWVDVLKIYPDRLEIWSLFRSYKRTILIADIQRWAETTYQYKFRKTDGILTIFTADTKYKIDHSLYKNYPEIKEYLTAGKPRDTTTELKWAQHLTRGIGIGIILFSMLLLWLGWQSYKSENQPVNREQLITLTDELSAAPEIYTASKTPRQLRLHVKRYPEYVFIDDMLGNSVGYADSFAADVKQGDSVYLAISTNEYQNKLMKEKPVVFGSRIDIYEFGTKKKNYFSLANYNAFKYSDDVIGVWVCGAMGIIFMGMGIFLVWKKIHLRYG